VSSIHVLSGIVFSFLVFFFELFGSSWKTTTETIRWIARIFPTFSASLATMRYTELAWKNGMCSILSKEAKAFICDPSITSIDPSYRQCCENCKTLPGVTCFTPVPYISWSHEKMGVGGHIVAGIGEELLIMIIMGFVYQAVLMIVEYHLIQKLFEKEEDVFEDHVTDDDVKTEVNRVVDMIQEGIICMCCTYFPKLWLE